MRNLLVALCGSLTVLLSAQSARAQSVPGPLPFVPQVETPKIEATIGITVNSLAVDVNAPSRCQTFVRPCSNSHPNGFGGFGVDLTFAVNRSDRYAAVFVGHAHEHEWDSGQPASRSEWNATRTLLVGERIQSDWVILQGFSKEPSRFFAQALAGVGSSTATGRHPIVQIGGGVDGIVQVPSRYTNRLVDLTLRMSFDYRIPLVHGTDLRGAQFGFAIVLGPHR